MPLVSRVQVFCLPGGVGGNGAGVLLLPPAGAASPSLRGDAGAIPAERLQRVAAAVALSETSFVQRRADGAYDLRWFTPTREVALCGHGTLAAAHALWRSSAGEASSLLAFHTASGVLAVRRGAGGGAPCARFPLASAHPSACTTHRALVAALLPPAVAAAAELWHSPATGKLLAVLAEDDGGGGAALLRALPRGGAASSRALLAVDQAALPPAQRVSGVSLSARCDAAARRAAGGAADFCSRYFSPWNGLDEDPVNGSSHTALAAIWASRLAAWTPHSDGSEVALLRAVQLSREGGVLEVRVVRPLGVGGVGDGGDDGGDSFVELGGETVTVDTDILAGRGGLELAGD